MNSPRPFFLLLVALLVSCFGLAAHLQPQFQLMQLDNNHKKWVVDLHGPMHSLTLSRASGDIFNVVLGDSRRVFANSFYGKAYADYQSCYYPTMFDDDAAFQTAHRAGHTAAVNHKNQGGEHGFLGP